MLDGRICVHCGKPGYEHHSKTRECPSGRKTTIGYIVYGPDVFAPQEEPSAYQQTGVTG